MLAQIILILAHKEIVFKSTFHTRKVTHHMVVTGNDETCMSKDLNCQQGSTVPFKMHKRV